MIKIVVNSLGSGDWIKIIFDDKTLIWEGHRPTVYDLQYILDVVGQCGCKVEEYTDDQMEEFT